MIIKISPFQRSNLLQFLNRVETKGVDEANALLELWNLIQSAEEDKEDKKIDNK